MDAPAVELDEEQDVQALEPDGLDREEVGRDHALCLCAQERGPREAGALAGITLSEAKRAFLVHGDDRVGAVAESTAKLVEASINVTAAAGTSAGSGRYGMILWVAPADYENAAGVLGV